MHPHHAVPRAPSLQLGSLGGVHVSSQKFVPLPAAHRLGIAGSAEAACSALRCVRVGANPHRCLVFDCRQRCCTRMSSSSLAQGLANVFSYASLVHATAGSVGGATAVSIAEPWPPRSVHPITISVTTAATSSSFLLFSFLWYAYPSWPHLSHLSGFDNWKRFVW